MQLSAKRSVPQTAQSRSETVFFKILTGALVPRFWYIPLILEAAVVDVTRILETVLLFMFMVTLLTELNIPVSWHVKVADVCWILFAVVVLPIVLFVRSVAAIGAPV